MSIPKDEIIRRKIAALGVVLENGKIQVGNKLEDVLDMVSFQGWKIKAVLHRGEGPDASVIIKRGDESVRISVRKFRDAGWIWYPIPPIGGLIIWWFFIYFDLTVMDIVNSILSFMFVNL